MDACYVKPCRVKVFLEHFSDVGWSTMNRRSVAGTAITSVVYMSSSSRMTDALWEGPNRRIQSGRSSFASRRRQAPPTRWDSTSMHEEGVFSVQVLENSVFSLQVTAVANRRSVPIAAAALSVSSTCSPLQT